MLLICFKGIKSHGEPGGTRGVLDTYVIKPKARTNDNNNHPTMKANTAKQSQQANEQRKAAGQTNDGTTKTNSPIKRPQKHMKNKYKAALETFKS